VLERAKLASRSTGALLMNATVKAVEGDTLVLTIGAAPLAKRLSEQRNTDVIAAALRGELGVVWRVRCEHDDPGAAPRAAAPPRTAPAAGTHSGGGSRPTPQPAQSAPTARRVPVRPLSPNDPPLPPEPPSDEDDEEEYFAESAGPATVEASVPVNRRDPQETAIELLTSQLGAQALNEPRR
jgi:DNA polymerase-3 subunit gamma/tau